MTTYQNCVLELQKVIRDTVFDNVFNDDGVEIPVDVTNDLNRKSFLFLFVDAPFESDTYEYLFTKTPSVPVDIQRRFFVKENNLYVSLSSSTTNLFGLEQEDLQWLDILHKYRNGPSSLTLVNSSDATSTSVVTLVDGSTTVTSNVNVINTVLSKLIFMYLDLKINNSYSDYISLGSSLVSDPNNILSILLEIQLVKLIFEKVSGNV